MLALATLLLLTAPTAEAKGKPGRKSKKTEAAAEKADTTKKEKKGYEELLKGAVTDKGMFDVHRKGTDFLFEIPDSLMGRDILIVNKISGVPYALNDAGVNKGMGYGEKIVRFRKDTLYKKVWVMTYDPRITSPEGDRITRSVRDNYRETAIEQFPIDAYGKDSASVVIKVNKVFDGSEKSFNNVFGSIGLPGSPKKDLSKIESVKSFPENIIVKSLLSTSHTEEGTTIPLTVEITSNLVLLAREPMRPRFSDDRVGYFEIGHLYFNDEQQKAEERAFINRWRLEPKPEDVERYKKGELVEPQKPIELWIDPATPPVWVPYIKKGIVEWQEAFEAAGFKNAIVAREVTPDDREFDIDDVRYSVVTYAASEMANAMGPSVIDPRSGEIIEADIIWWHNVMSILHAWIRLQTGAVDPAARGNTLPTEVMGNAVRFVSSHELGHSLGLKHNFGASYSVPVDSLRSKSYTATNGTASSIMDYARFNYVAQPEDGITQLTPKIGTYDKHAINWGYRWLDVQDPHEELPTLNAWLREHENDPEYWYGEQSREGIDPRSQSEDLSNDAVLASTYGLKNLRRIIPHVTDWTSEEGKLQYEGGRLLRRIILFWTAIQCNLAARYRQLHIGSILLYLAGRQCIHILLLFCNHLLDNWLYRRNRGLFILNRLCRRFLNRRRTSRRITALYGVLRRSFRPGMNFPTRLPQRRSRGFYGPLRRIWHRLPDRSRPGKRNTASKHLARTVNSNIGKLQTETGIRQRSTQCLILGSLYIVSTFFCTMLRDVTADGLCITAVQIDSGLHNRKLFRDSQGSQFHAALWVTQTEPQFLIRQFQLQHFLIGLSGYLMAQKFERVKARHLVQFCHCRNCFVHHRHRITFFVHVGNSFLT